MTSTSIQPNWMEIWLMMKIWQKNLQDNSWRAIKRTEKTQQKRYYDKNTGCSFLDSYCSTWNLFCESRWCFTGRNCWFDKIISINESIVVSFHKTRSCWILMWYCSLLCLVILLFLRFFYLARTCKHLFWYVFSFCFVAYWTCIVPFFWSWWSAHHINSNKV